MEEEKKIQLKIIDKYASKANLLPKGIRKQVELSQMVKDFQHIFEITNRSKDDDASFVGPFFIISDLENHQNVYGYPDYVNQDRINDCERDYLDAFINHSDLFDEIVIFYPKLYLSSMDDYGYYPRGRVLYNIKKDTFKIYCDQCILKEESLKQIILNYFGISEKIVDWEADDHYTCHRCRTEIKEELK